MVSDDRASKATIFRFMGSDSVLVPEHETKVKFISEEGKIPGSQVLTTARVLMHPKSRIRPRS